jgi:hypothetical protein
MVRAQRLQGTGATQFMTHAQDAASYSFMRDFRDGAANNYKRCPRVRLRAWKHEGSEKSLAAILTHSSFSNNACDQNPRISRGE